MCKLSARTAILFNKQSENVGEWFWHFGREARDTLTMCIDDKNYCIPSLRYILSHNNFIYEQPRCNIRSVSTYVIGSYFVDDFMYDRKLKIIFEDYKYIIFYLKGYEYDIHRRPGRYLQNDDSYIVIIVPKNYHAIK